MSLLPYIVNELIQDRYDPVERLYDQHFGIGLRNDDLHRSSLMGITSPFLAGYIRPLRHLHPDESGISNIQDEKNNFKISLDVQQFKPEEIKVKIVDDCVLVEGKHEERQDKHGFISRQFTRRYKLPQNANVEAIKSSLSSDGVLSIVAPKKVIEESTKDRTIPIARTNKPAIKQTAKLDKSEKMET